MLSFGHSLTEAYASKLKSYSNPTFREAVEALYASCVASGIEEREDVETFSIIGEVDETLGERNVYVTFHFETNINPSGDVEDYRDSIECSFTVGDFVDANAERMELDEMALEEMFHAFRKWPTYVKLKDKSLPFSWDGPCENEN